MKKLLLLLFVATLGAANAQNNRAAGDYWTEYATAQSAASTTERSISIVDENVSWLSNSCGTTGCTTIRRYSRTLDAGLTWNTGVVDLGAGAAGLEIGNIHGVSATVAFASVFPKAAGAIGGVYKTIDAGLTWTRQASATYGSADSFANLVYFWDANNGVTMGDPDSGYFEIYTTTNGGTTWVRTPSGNIPAPLSPGPEYGLTNQFTTNGNVIWIGTTSGRILKSVDKGLNWTISQSPIPDFGGGLNGSEGGDLCFTDTSNGILITTDFLLYKTSDGGVTWAPVLYNGPLKSFGVAAIPTKPNTYVSVGSDAVNDPARGSSYSEDGGLNWTDIDNNPDTNLVDGSVVAFFSPTMGLAAGFSVSAAVGGVFKWNNTPFLANDKFAANAIFTVSPNPTSDKLNLSGANINQVQITDILGKVVFNNSYSSLSNVELSIAEFTAGMYMVKVTNNEGISSVVKVVKQ